MAALAGPFIVTAVLLAAGGAAKLVRPDGTVGAVREMGLAASPALVRMGAAAELAVAAGALAGGGRVFAGPVAASHPGFALFVLAALRRGVPLSSCGCFGAQDTPPTPVHLVLNVAAAGVAGAVALGLPGGDGLLAVTSMDGSLLLRAAFAISTAAAAWLAYAALTLLPRLRSVTP